MWSRILALSLLACGDDPPEARADPEADTDADADADGDTDADGDADADADAIPIPAIEALAPGSAGRINLLTVSGAPPGGELLVASSVSRGQGPVPGCPSLSADLDAPAAIADPDGRARLEVFVDPAASGRSGTFRVIHPASCAISEPLLVGFPDRAERDLSDADAVLTGGGWLEAAGTSVSSAGDLDGDGYADLLVGSPGFDIGPGATGEGRAYLIHGPVSGRLALEDADAVLAGELRPEEVGWSVAGVGDTDRDGRDDLLIGAPRSDADGRAYLVRGPVRGELGLGDADAVLASAVSSWVGHSVAGAGDTDGDGSADLLIGAPIDGPGWGRAYLVGGPVSGRVDLDRTGAVFTGEELYDAVGWSVSGAGDVDGDGGADLLIGAPGLAILGHAGPGRAYLVLAPAAGALDLGDSDAVLLGEGPRDEAGSSVSSAGDIDGDGYADLLIGAPGRAGGGGAYLVLGPVQGEIDLGTADAILLGVDPEGRAGESVSGAGDVDADGRPDLVIGAPGALGAAYLVRGPVLGRIALSDADAALFAEDRTDRAGASVSSAGDVDGDGRDDLLLGAPDRASTGAAYLILGGGI